MAERTGLIGDGPRLERGTLILRPRLLPCRGEVLVEPGDHLEPDDVVARCARSDQIVALDLADALQVPVDDVPGYVLVRPGQAVLPTTLVAARTRWGVGARRAFAGLDGVAIGLQEGSLFIRTSAAWVQLRAYLPGVVSEIYPESGVLMRATGSVLHGIWGSGREATGLLTLEASAPDEPLAWNRIGSHHYGMILAAGVLQSVVALRRAAQYGVAGIVAGSLHPDLRQTCRELPYPVLVTEGMGRIPMAAPVWGLLRAHQGSRVILAGDSRLTATGPEMILPGPLLTANLPAAPLAPGIGSLVRLTGYGHLGAVGEIVSISEPQTSPAGERLRTVWVRLTDRRLVQVPLENTELLAGAAPDPFSLLR